MSYLKYQAAERIKKYEMKSLPAIAVNDDLEELFFIDCFIHLHPLIRSA